MVHSDQREFRQQNIVHHLYSVLIFIFGLVYIAGVFVQRTDSDEWQQLVMSVDVARGEALYADVWDNHGPALTYLIAVPLKLFPTEKHQIVYWLRAGIFICFTLPTLVFFIAWLRKFFGRVEMGLALLFMLGCWALFQKGLEIRSDNPLSFIWMLSLYLWFSGLQKEKWSWFLLSGLALGCGFAFNIKTLFIGFATGLMFLTAAFYDRRALLWMIPFAIGCTVGPLVMAAALYSGGILDDFWRSYVGENFDRPPRPLGEGYDVLRDGSKLWAHLMFASLLFTLWMAIKRRLPKYAVILWPCAFFLVFQFLFLLPTVHDQSLLMALPPCTALMAVATVEAWNMLRQKYTRITEKRWNAIAFVALSVFAINSIASFRMWDRFYIREQIQRANRFQELIPEGELVLTGYSQPLFRPQPTKYRSLVEHLRYSARLGKLDFNFVEVLAARDVPYVMFDDRVRDLDDETVAFIRDNYVPLNIAPLRAAGKVLRPVELSAADVSIAITGDYFWRTQNEGTELAIDGIAAPNPVRLEDGVYRFEWNGEGPLVLCIRDPEDWLMEADPRRARESRQ